MEIIKAGNVKVPNSLIITDFSHTTTDEELFDYLKRCGSIARIINVSEPSSEFHIQVIVEFRSGEAFKTLEEILPLDRPSDANTEIVHHVEALASVYSCERGTGITHTFLSELGKTYWQVI